jgi:hypothetical protein
MGGAAAGRDWLRLAACEEDQIPWLAAFRAAHPEVVIGDPGFGAWQARIPEPEVNGETVITRYTLRELLGKLDEVTGPDGGQPGGLKTAGRTAHRTAGEQRPAIRRCSEDRGPFCLLSLLRGEDASDGPGDYCRRRHPEPEVQEDVGRHYGVHSDLLPFSVAVWQVTSWPLPLSVTLHSTEPAVRPGRWLIHRSSFSLAMRRPAWGRLDRGEAHRWAWPRTTRPRGGSRRWGAG